MMATMPEDDTDDEPVEIQISVHLDTEAMLERLSARQQRPVSEIIDDAIKQYIIQQIMFSHHKNYRDPL